MVDFPPKHPPSRLRRDAISFNAAISACEKGGQWRLALGLLQAMPAAQAGRRARRMPGRCFSFPVGGLDWWFGGLGVDSQTYLLQEPGFNSSNHQRTPPIKGYLIAGARNQSRNNQIETTHFEGLPKRGPAYGMFVFQGSLVVVG